MVEPKGYSKLMVEKKIHIFVIFENLCIFIGYNNINRSPASKN